MPNWNQLKDKPKLGTIEMFELDRVSMCAFVSPFFIATKNKVLLLQIGQAVNLKASQGSLKLGKPFANASPWVCGGHRWPSVS